MPLFSTLRARPDDAGLKDPPLSLSDVLEAELEHLHGARSSITSVPGSFSPPSAVSGTEVKAPETGQASAPDPQERLDRIRRDMNACGHSAICLSGGGIRSASFALGVIQGLAHKGLLTTFDYLSTVSGGGFAGGWLAAWLYRTREEGAGLAVSSVLAGFTRATDAVEPGPVRRMRNYGRYMSPQAGFFSADGWTLGATVLRNLVLNWTVLLPLVAATLMLPLIYRELIAALYVPPNSSNTISLLEPSTAVLAGSVVMIMFGLGFMAFNLPGAGDRRCSEREFLLWCHLPICAGILGLTLYWAMEDVEIGLKDILIANTLGQSLTWIPVNLVLRTRRWRPRTLIALAVSGAVTSVPLWALTQLFQDSSVMSASYLVLAFPLLMLTVDLVVVLFVGLAGADIGDGDLEWYSRGAAWDLITVVSWLLVGGIVFYVPSVLTDLRDSTQHATSLSTLAATEVVILEILVVVCGAGLLIRMITSGAGAVVRRIAMAAAGPTLVLVLLGSLAWANTSGLSHMRQHALIATRGPGYLGTSLLPEALVLFVALLLFGLMTGRLVRVNKFSLHGMYRERLTRAFLGASRAVDARRPNPFTGFDPADDLEIGKLAAITRPILVVNMTLNKIGRASLAGLYRKAVSFTASSLHTGSSSVGYRSSAEYGSDHARGHRGISLGTAMTISGAAASPNMGTFSSPMLTFLLTLFNARLGAWLGNPAAAGTSWRRGEPKHSLAPLLAEMLGRTTDDSPYVYLSDGGHFENLGLYEMVLRRCRYILVCDAGCDPTFTFHDLANAIRQVRIDMGIPIVFDHGIGIGDPTSDRTTGHYAVATIQYSAIDGRQADDGLLLYIKPVVSGDEPVDVLTYRKAQPLFPHEPTADQWFDEAQFESYRALGFHSVPQIPDPHTGPFRLPEFFAVARAATVKPREAPQESPATPARVLGTV